MVDPPVLVQGRRSRRFLQTGMIATPIVGTQAYRGRKGSQIRCGTRARRTDFVTHEQPGGCLQDRGGLAVAGPRRRSLRYRGGDDAFCGERTIHQAPGPQCRLVSQNAEFRVGHPVSIQEGGQQVLEEVVLRGWNHKSDLDERRLAEGWTDPDGT